MLFFRKIINIESESWKNDTYEIWLTPYYIKERWVKGGSSRIRMKGMFSNVYYDGWKLIGQGFDKNVKTWRKYKN